MKGKERRQHIYYLLSGSAKPLPGATLAQKTGVSRQVVVQDIALMRADGIDILSTNRGYCLRQAALTASRVFKVNHSDEQTEEELTTIIDLGGKVEDVFVFHRVYGVLKAPLTIRSRRDIAIYLSHITPGPSTLLKNTTAGYHYHTVTADSEELLDLIQTALAEKGFLAKLQDYEPVDFWHKDATG